MDTLLRSHLLISFPQVGGRATELPSPGRSGDALQPLREWRRTQMGFPVCSLGRRRSTEPARNLKCSRPLLHMGRWLCSQTSILPPPQKSRPFLWTFPTSLPERVLLAYHFPSRSGQGRSPRSSQPLLAFSEPACSGYTCCQRQDAALLPDRVWALYPDSPYSKKRQRRDAH